MRSIVPWLALALLTAFPVYSQPVETALDLEIMDWVTFPHYDATRMGWVPDGSGRLFVTTMSGKVIVVEDGVLQPTPFISESFEQGHEQQGLLGMAFDPDFANNHYVYFFAAMPGYTLQIFRYTDVGGVGVNRTVIVDGLQAGVLDYDGGGMTFGPDGMLYFGVGSLHGYRDPDVLTNAAGKIHRVRPDGTVPTDNPFYDGAGPNVDSIWARGFCNLYGLVFQPGTGRLWANASGPGAVQIFSVSPGEHGGWPDYENNQPAGYLSPVYSYMPGTNDQYPFTPTGAVRQNGVATFTMMGDDLESSWYRKGARLLIRDVEDPSFNGDFYVTGHPSSRSFTVDQPEPDAVSGGGRLRRWPEGDFSMGGMFYEGTRFPASYSSNYLYTDFRGMLHRIRFAVDGSVATDDIIINREGGGGFVDVSKGPDGALYVLSYYGVILRVTPTPEGQALIVSPSDLVIPEGETQTVMVSLAMPPLVDVWVKVAVQGGEGDLSVVEGGSLRFTLENWSVPQFVTLGAAQDADADVEHASFTFTPTQDFPVVTVHARTEEDEVPEEPANDGGVDGGAEVDAGTVEDAGTFEDAGTLEDAGTIEDAGTVEDAGTLVDAGAVVDAGSTKDGGTVPVHMEDESGGCSAGASALPGVLAWWLLSGLVWRPLRARR
ncbi:PQQ-dependent sugar dehydrogenase [Corallococcus exiguus]|uniref:PQQ-dependent sugar dehydrogenase n=1 Tax=Corallococcus exiguus TaxID=83462 RepID=UPI00155FF9F9|nr:PQQ-dependent sugar dehydrogenase [Corallococcus exiguus]NRD46619.1 PQQ-dependent sugar dehydrogenase [Corallococcus exiguus]